MESCGTSPQYGNCVVKYGTPSTTGQCLLQSGHASRSLDSSSADLQSGQTKAAETSTPAESADAAGPGCRRRVACCLIEFVVIECLRRIRPRRTRQLRLLHLPSRPWLPAPRSKAVSEWRRNLESRNR